MAPTNGRARAGAGGASSSSASGASGAPSSLGPNGAPLTAASAQDLEHLKRLAQIIIRMFYQDQSIMIIDQLVKFEVIPADKLADRLSVGVKELKAQVQKLVEDRLVSVHIRAEPPPLNPNRPPPPPEIKLRPWKRPYYYLDLPTFFSIIKWRVSKIYKSIDSLTSSVAALTSRGFLCPRCGARYDSFDVNHLLDFETNKLRCDVPGCGEELAEDEDKETAKRKEDKMQRFNLQFGSIMAALRRLESIALPKTNVDAYLLINGPSIDWKAYDVGDAEIKALSGDLTPSAGQDGSKASAKGEDGLKIATGGNQAILGALQVDVSAMLDPAAEAAKKRAAEEETRRKRGQNALPDWHLRSTVSDQATSLGLEEERRRKMLDGEYALMDAEKAKGNLNGAGADGKDATAEYYASMQWGQDDEDEGEDEDDAEAFEEVAAAGGSVPVPALPADVSSRDGSTKKRSAEEEPDTGNVNGNASKKARAEEASPVPSAAPATQETAGAKGGDEEGDEDEEFEEV